MPRLRLPARRAHAVVEFVHGGVPYVAGFGGDGGTHELFLNAGKAGTSLEAMSRDAAVVLSLALQYGAPLDEIRAALTREDDGRPSGPVGAFLDLIAEEAA